MARPGKVFAIVGPLLTGVVAGALTGCGERGSSGPAGQDLPVVVVDGEVQVSCGGPPGWSPSVMADGIEPPVPAEEVSSALDAVAAEPGLSVETRRVLPEGGRTPWRVLAGDERVLHLGLGTWTVDGPADGAHAMTLEQADDGLRWAGHGDCQLSPLLAADGSSWVEVTEAEVHATGTGVTVTVNERECTTARDPGPFLHEPTLVEDDESVTVYWTSSPPAGDQACPGNPSVQRTITLTEPLGDRRLLDGSTWPPTPVP